MFSAIKWKKYVHICIQKKICQAQKKIHFLKIPSLIIFPKVHPIYFYPPCFLFFYILLFILSSILIIFPLPSTLPLPTLSLWHFLLLLPSSSTPFFPSPFLAPSLCLPTYLRRRRVCRSWGWCCGVTCRTRWQRCTTPPWRAGLHSGWGRYWRLVQRLDTSTYQEEK